MEPTFTIPKSNAQGFTLIEMMLAVAIFAMVVGVLFTSFRVGIGSWEKGGQDVDLFQEIRAVSEILYREVNSTYPYRLTPSTLDRHKEFYAFFGASDSLKFVSYAHLDKKIAGLSLLEFWVDSEKGLMVGQDIALVSNESDLEAISLREDDKSSVLSPHIKKMVFRYFERKTPGSEGEWVERWNADDQGKRLPQFVEVTLTFVDDRDEEVPHRVIVPLMCTAMENL